MTVDLPSNYLTTNEACEKYSFLNKNRLKNLMYTNPNQFREKVIRRLGGRLFVSEDALLKYLDESK